MKRILINLLSYEPVARILETAEGIFGRILAAGIAMSFLIGVILLLRFLLRNYRRSYSYYLWSILGMLCVLVVIPGSVFHSAGNLIRSLTGEFSSGSIPMQIGKWNQSVSRFFTPAHTSGISVTPSVSSESGTLMTAASGQTADIIPDTPAVPSADTVSYAELLPALITLIWLTGIMILTILSVLSYCRVNRSIRFATKTDEPDVWESDQIPDPFVKGLFRARIYLPVSTNPGHLQYILLHERYHIYRRDNFVLLFAQIIVILFWFHPLIWLARELMRKDMEISCDEEAVAGLPREYINDYSAALLVCGTDRRTTPMAHMGSKKSLLSCRIEEVLVKKKTSLFLFMTAVSLGLAAVILCLPLVSGSGDVSAVSSEAMPDAVTASEKKDAADTSDRQDKKAENDMSGDKTDQTDTTDHTIDPKYQTVLEKHLSFAKDLGASVSAVVTDGDGRILAQTGDTEMRAFPGSSLDLITAAALRQSLPQQLSSVNIFDHYLNWLTGVTNNLSDIEEIYLQADFKKAESFLREAGAGDLTFDSARQFYDYSTGQGQEARQYTASELNEMCRRIFEGETSLKGADLEELRQQSEEYLLRIVAVLKDNVFQHIDISPYDPDVGLAGAVGTDMTEITEAIDRRLSYEESHPLYSYAFFSGFVSISGQNIYVTAIAKDDDTNSLFNHVTHDSDMAVFNQEVAFAVNQMFSELQGEN